VASPIIVFFELSSLRALGPLIINFCNYVNIYFKIKKKYNLSFKNNDTDLFNKCSIKIKNSTVSTGTTTTKFFLLIIYFYIRKE